MEFILAFIRVPTTCSNENEYFKIEYWPQPTQSTDRKITLLLSACFIQGAQLAQVATQLRIPIQTVQQFVSACMISNKWGHYSSNRKQLFKVRCF